MPLPRFIGAFRGLVAMARVHGKSWAVAWAVVLLPVAGIALYQYWQDAPKRWAERVTGLKLPSMMLVYVQPRAGETLATVMLEFENGREAAPYVRCDFPGYLKDYVPAAIRLDYLHTTVEIPQPNCYRRERAGENDETTIVFSRYSLFITTTMPKNYLLTLAMNRLR